MQRTQAIDPLPLEQFPLESDTQDPGFEQLFNDLVGNAATDADGFDADVAEANSLLDALDNALTALSGQEGGTLDDTFLEILELDPTDAGEHVVDLAAGISDADTNVDKLGDLLAQASPITPPAAPAAVKIQTATGPVLTCNARQGMGPGACSNYPCSTVAPFVNNTQQPRHVSKIVLVQAAGGPFTATTDCPDTLQPGQSCKFNISIAEKPPAGAKAQLQFYFDQAGSPAVFCVDDGVGSFGYGSGGGGGGPFILAPTP